MGCWFTRNTAVRLKTRGETLASPLSSTPCGEARSHSVYFGSKLSVTVKKKGFE